MRILQVEDDLVLAKSIELTLKAEGYFCETTGSGEQAVELAQKNQYDVILLDVALPGIDGYEVLHQLQTAGTRSRILFMSGLIGRDSRCRGTGLGVEHYLVKPFNRNELTAKLQAMSEEDKPNTAYSENSSDDDKKRRRILRKKIIKMATIICDDEKHYEMECTLFSLSVGGAALKPDKSDFFCPERFKLKTVFGTIYDCEVCWRYRNKVGVRFVS